MAEKKGQTKQPTVGNRGTTKGDMPTEQVDGKTVVGERARTSGVSTGDRAGNRRTSGGAKEK